MATKITGLNISGALRLNSSSTQPNIVTNGLLVYFDAGQSSSYPGTGNIWYDISGNNNNGIFINGPTYSSSQGGCIVFDGIDDYVQFGAVSAQTICFWGRAEPSSADLPGLVCTSATGDGALRTQSGSFRVGGDMNDFQQNYPSQFMINGVSNLPSNGFGQYVIPNGRTIYQDFYVGAIGSPRIMSTISHLFMGRAYKGRVYTVQIYNRQLTNNELLQNYDAFRGRYGL